MVSSVFLMTTVGYDEFYECPFKEKYIGEETGQAYTCSFWRSVLHVPNWSDWKVQKFLVLFFHDIVFIRLHPNHFMKKFGCVDEEIRFSAGLVEKWW